jgi:hypothetical protein
MFDGVSIHSHPRSGNMFLVNNIATLFLGTGLETKKSGKHMLENEKLFRVAIIRNPIDTILSAYSHFQYFENQEENFFSKKAIEDQVDNYVDHMKILSSCSPEIKLYKFEEIDSALLDIASRFVVVPDDFVAKFPENTNKHLATTKNTAAYAEILKNIKDYDVFSPAIECYNSMINNIKN